MSHEPFSECRRRACLAGAAPRCALLAPRCALLSAALQGFPAQRLGR
ncbi:hypothetical protein [Deinococcus sp.]|nr:hypothetical protein [Deinococcus sp.]